MNKNSTQAFVNQMLVYTLVMICFSGSIGIGTVWLRQQIAQTANHVRQLQTRTAEVSRRTDETTALIATESSPDMLARKNAEWHLGLVQPSEPQVRRVDEPVEQRLAQKRNSDLFRDRSAQLQPVNFNRGGQTR